MVSQWFKKSNVIPFTALILALLFALACGTSSPAEPQVVEKEGIVEKEVVVVEKVVVATPTPAPAPAVTTVNPGKLTIMTGEFGNERFDRTLGLGGGGDNAIRFMHGFLLSENAEKELLPGIASKWGVSADGLTWTFTIRKGVKFHDGSEVTTEDVLWSYQHSLGPQAREYTSHGSALRIAANIDRIESTGPDKVSMTSILPEPGLVFTVSAMGPDYLHVMPKRAKLHDEEVERAYDQNPIGAGIMSLEKHVAAHVIKFQRFDDFYYRPDNGFPEDKRVNFQSLDLFLVPEEATRVAALRAGEADIAPVTVAAKKQVEAGGGRLVFGPEGVIIDITLYGCYDPQYPCHDRRVRQALNYAFDKTVLRDRLFGGPEVFQIKGWVVITPSTVGYTPELDPWPFDPDKARQLLADAGYPGGEGFGKLIINTAPSQSLPQQIEVAQLTAEFWKRELGLDVEVRVSENVVRKKREAAYDINGQIWMRDNETRIDGAVGGVIANRYNFPDNYYRLHEDPEIFALMNESWGILDAEQKAEALKPVYLRLRDESYHLGVGYANIPWAVGPRVLTWQPYPLSLSPSALHTITLK